MEIRRNLSLWLGLAIPVLMIIFVAASIYLPGLFVKPQVDFLYAIEDYPTHYEQQGEQFTEHTYFVRSGKLTKETRPAEENYRWPYRFEKPTFYLYDVETDANQELTFEQAQALTLDTSKKSPDGFEVTYGRSDGGVFPFVFWSDRDYDERYLKRNSTSKAISVKTGSDGYYKKFNFIGWVVE